MMYNLFLFLRVEYFIHFLRNLCPVKVKRPFGWLFLKKFITLTFMFMSIMLFSVHAQSCQLLAKSLLPGSSVHRILQVRILEWVGFLLQGIFLAQGMNPPSWWLLHRQVDSLPLCHIRSLLSSINHIRLTFVQSIM